MGNEAVVGVNAVFCEKTGHGVALVATLPERVEPGDATMMNETTGCAPCIAERVARTAIEMAEQAEREKEDARRAKKEAMREARESDARLAAACDDFDRLVVDAGIVARHKQDLDRAAERVRKLKEKLESVRLALETAKAEAAEKSQAFDDVEAAQASAERNLTTAFEESEAKWSAVRSRQKRDSRDKKTRARARKLLGLDRRNGGAS